MVILLLHNKIIAHGKGDCQKMIIDGRKICNIRRETDQHW
jgi:hypothetical protein